MMHVFDANNTHQLPLGLRVLATAEIAEGPGGVSQHAEFGVLAQQAQKGAKRARLQNLIAALGAVTRNVPERPNGLLTDIGDVGGEEIDKLWDRASIDHKLCVLCCSRCDVGQCPSSFKLESFISGVIRRYRETSTHLEHRVVALQKLNKARDDAAFDDLFDRWVLLLGEQFAEASGRVKLALLIL